MVRECCSSRPVTKQAQGAVRGIESSPRVPRGELSGRFAPRRKETKKEHRSFGTIIETRGRFKVRYTGPDRQLHRAGITFTTRERAQGWLSDERKLIELNEWTPPERRRAQLQVQEITFDKFAREWIDKRLVKGRLLKDRTREPYLDLHERWRTPLHHKTLSSLTHADVDRWYHALPDAPTMRIHAYSLLKAIYRTAVTVRGQRVITTPKSNAGRRTIYLPPHLTEDVRQHLATYTRPDPDALVFPGTDGQPLSVGQVHGHTPRFNPRTGKKVHPGNGFYRARHEIGRPDFRFHDLRHFAATMAAISGATTKELMQFAGHSDIHVAMRYQEAVSERKKDLARRMTELARNNWSDDVSQNAARSRARRDRRD